MVFNLEYIRHIETVYALNVPVYYYVKTKGSLVSQSTGMKNVIRMKRSVFAYYNKFYKDVFEEVDYEKGRSSSEKYVVTPEAESIISELLFVLSDFEQIQYKGFSQEEVEIYEKLKEKRDQNIRRVLR